MTERATLRIVRLAAGGDGVGTWPDGRVAFVPRTAPGDLVEAHTVGQRPRFVRAVPDRIVAPGPGRVTPRCAHYGPDRCGGCQLQHVDGATQAAAKRAFVGDALRRIGKLRLPDPLFHAATEPWAYRTKITLAFRGHLGGPEAGFHRWDDPGAVFPLERCEIAAPALQRLWTALRPRLAAAPADTGRLVLREDEAGTCHVTATDLERPEWPDAQGLVDELATAGVGAVLWAEPKSGPAERVAPATARHSEGAQVFEQVNPAMARHIRARAVELLDSGPGAAVWDLYAGTGKASSLLAGVGANVESVEVDRRAVRVAELADTPGVTRHAGRVEDLLPVLADPDAVLVNPPRTGLGPRVVEGLRRRRPRRVVYVSCDPATLARDLAGLAPDYRATTVEAYDQFPQTAHVETVVALQREGGA